MTEFKKKRIEIQKEIENVEEKINDYKQDFQQARKRAIEREESFKEQIQIEESHLENLKTEKKKLEAAIKEKNDKLEDFKISHSSYENTKKD